MFQKRLTPFALAMVSGALVAGAPGQIDPARLVALKAQESTRAALAMQRLEAARSVLGLKAEDQFLTGRIGTDSTGTLHVHLRQTYRGVPVWGGDAILHMDVEGVSLPASDKLVRGLDMAVVPAMDGSEALALATRDMQPKGGLSLTSTPQLVIAPRAARSLRAGVAKAGANAADVVTTVSGGELAYHLHLETRSQDDTRDMDYLVSAVSGAILKKWSSLETAAVQGTGNSQYSGSVSLTTNQLSASSYEMRDPNRGSTVVSGFGTTAGSVVTDMANGTSGNGTLYTDADNTWGDGNNFYDGTTAGGTSGVTGQTAAVDAKFGFDATWDYYKNVHGRNGIDNNGTSTTLRMHYNSKYDNAFWNDSCFCMTFGDGSATPTGGGLKNVTALDVIGHELSHGVIANSVAGGLNYYDESGGLNEADSDINGTFITYYGYNGATGAAVPDTIAAGNLHGYTPWQIGSQLSTPPLRYMYKPSLDGISPDAWYFDIGSLDVHLSSGPMNRAMYFLAKGATVSGDTSTTYLPSGMTGIGNDKASKIWYSVMTNYLTSASTYHDARLACIAAAKALYSGTETAPTPELAAVQNAFHGINVGPAAGQADDTQAPTGVTASENGTSGTVTLGATATDNVGVAHIDLAIDGTVVTGMSAAGTTPFDSHLLANGSHTLVATAYDAYRNKTASAPVSFSTLNSYAQFLIDPGFELNSASWGFGANPGGVAQVTTNATYAHAGSKYAILGGTAQSYAYQIFTLPAGLPSAPLTLWVRISTTSTSSSATDKMAVQVYDSSLNTLKSTLATYSNKDATGNSAATSSWVQVGPLDLKPYAGQTIALVFLTNPTEGKTSFRLDDLALLTQYAKPDENGDGKVDGIDLGIFAKGYGTDPLSDFNNDGNIDDADAVILLNAFGK